MRGLGRTRAFEGQAFLTQLTNLCFRPEAALQVSLNGFEVLGSDGVFVKDEINIHHYFEINLRAQY